MPILLQQRRPESRPPPSTAVDSAMRGVVHSLSNPASVVNLIPLDDDPTRPRRRSFGFNRARIWFKRLYKLLNLKLLIPLLIVMIYMVFGAVLFHWIEYGDDQRRKEAAYELYVHERRLLIKRMKEIVVDRPPNKSNLDRLDGWIDEAVDNYETNINVHFNNQSQWDFMSAMYYAGTVYTTIGYGDIVCYTTAGRIATVLYAMVGIPLMLSALNDLGKFLFELINNAMQSWKNFQQRVSKFMRRHRRNRQQPNADVGDAEQGTALMKSPDDIVRFHLASESSKSAGVSTNSEKDNHYNDDDDDVVIDVDDIVDRSPPPRIPVSVAIVVTVGWIFVCAGLFCMWEHNWTYMESCYFFFISLSTIGLGDVVPERRDLMVFSFVFVIIGLSFVSMCINVIQTALEELYMALLMKLLLDYQKKMAESGDALGASMGIMQGWGSNKTAKLLMPLLSKGQLRNATHKFQEEAKEQGIELPPILQQIDTETGLPTIFAIEKESPSSSDGDDATAAMQKFVQAAMTKAAEQQRAPSIQQLSEPAPPPSATPSTVVAYDADTQVDTISTCDRQEQTIIVTQSTIGTLTDVDKCASSDVEMQTCDDDRRRLMCTDADAQTRSIDVVESEMNTPTPMYCEADAQTESVHRRDAQLQSHLFDTIDKEAGTDVVEQRNQRIQTPYPEMHESESQTEPTTSDKSKSKTKLSKLRNALTRRPKESKYRRRGSLDQPIMSDWKEVTPDRNGGGDAVDEEDATDEEEDDDDPESLHWDPFDGLHAEKQLPVHKLKAMFDQPVAKAGTPPPLARASISTPPMHVKGGLQQRGASISNTPPMNANRKKK